MRVLPHIAFAIFVFAMVGATELFLRIQAECIRRQVHRVTEEYSL
jgi:hypothetical protein